jgi:hypothetical protein
MIGAKKATAIFNMQTGAKTCCMGGASYDNGRSQKIIPRWAGETLFARWDKNVRVWNLAGK